MSTLAASLKKFERWSGRLNDESSGVRNEALKIVGQIAEAEAALAARSLNTLAAYIRENKYANESGNMYWALDVVDDLPCQLVSKNPLLLDALVNVPLTDSTDAGVVGRILIKIVESDELPRASSHLQDIIQRSKSGLLLAHQGGRRDFMKIVDWAEDNDVHVLASLPKKAAEIKPRSKRPAAPDRLDGAEFTQAVGDQRTALPPQDVSVTAPFVLDHDQIREKQAESENVSGYLSQFFNPAEPENTQAFLVANSSVGARVALSGLEPILFAFALRLASRATWKRADAEALAASLGLMVDGALEHLNEAALDEWDVLFAEGNDPIELSAEAIAGLAKQAQAAAPS